MYNLTVDDAHTFFVGDGEWLVHNQEIPPSVPPFGVNIPQNTLVEWSVSNLVDNSQEWNSLVLNQYTPMELQVRPNPAEHRFYKPGFSGAYDLTTGTFLAVPNGPSADMTQGLPFGTVGTSNGHGAVANWLQRNIRGSKRSRMVGFTLGYARVANGQPELFIKWSSNSLNTTNFGDKKLEGRLDLRQQVIQGVAASVSCGVSDG